MNGKQIGRISGAKVETKKSKDVKKVIFQHSKDFQGSLKDIELIKLVRVSRNTFYKYKRELFEEHI